MAMLGVVGIPADNLGIRLIPAGVVLLEFSDVGPSLADMVMGFLEDGEGSSESSNYVEEEDEPGELGLDSGLENAAFWQTQHQLLEATLCRRSSFESRVRKDTLEALNNSRVTPVCVCQKPVVGGCRNCLTREVVESLRRAGYNAALCKSRWRSSHGILSGEHKFIDVVDVVPTKKAPVRVLIELDFRAEFEMVRASEEYNRLISQVPDLYVGKPDRLKVILKVICAAAKKCMKEKKMHLGPWRKQKYMEAKWLGSYERTAPPPLFPEKFSDRPPKLRASLLTFDLTEKLPSLHCAAVSAVEVV